MHKLKMRGMQSNASNELLGRFRPMVFSITDDGVAHRRKLRPDLILQSCDQLNPDERRICKNTVDAVSKFGANRLGISRRPQLLKHSFASKIVNQCPCFSAETAAQYRKIPPHGSVREKLSHERISIPISLRKQQNPGGKTIDAMHDQGSLFLQLQCCDKQRQSRLSIRALDRHSEKSGRFVESDHGVVFIEDGELPRETRLAPNFADRSPVQLSRTAASASRRLLHWLGSDNRPIIKPFR